MGSIGGIKLQGEAGLDGRERQDDIVQDQRLSPLHQHVPRSMGGVESESYTGSNDGLSAEDLACGRSVSDDVDVASAILEHTASSSHWDELESR